MLRFFFFFQAEDGIRDYKVTGVQTCALPICLVPFPVLPALGLAAVPLPWFFRAWRTLGAWGPYAAQCYVADSLVVEMPPLFVVYLHGMTWGDMAGRNRQSAVPLRGRFRA